VPTTVEIDAFTARTAGWLSARLEVATEWDSTLLAIQEPNAG
jgi:hypothetical protein